MNLYLIQQNQNQDYDTYDSAVVVAVDEEHAKTIHPAGYIDWHKMTDRPWLSRNWAANPENVYATLIGVAEPSLHRGVVLSSYNAG